MREQHIEHTVPVRRSGLEWACSCTCHDHHGCAAARVFPKKLGQRASERTVSTARLESLKNNNRFDHCGSRKIFNMNNCHTKDFQHENYPIYGISTRRSSVQPSCTSSVIKVTIIIQVGGSCQVVYIKQ